MDRAYRYGQTRDVEVFRLLGAGSLEELIYARQVYKQQQMAVGYDASVQTRYFEGVQGDKTKQGELFGLDNLFKLHEHTLATKMAVSLIARCGRCHSGFFVDRKSAFSRIRLGTRQHEGKADIQEIVHSGE